MINKTKNNELYAAILNLRLKTPDIGYKIRKSKIEIRRGKNEFFMHICQLECGCYIAVYVATKCIVYPPYRINEEILFFVDNFIENIYENHEC